MTDEKIQTIPQPVLNQIEPLMGKAVVIKTIEPERHGFTARNYLRVTKLTTDVLGQQIEKLRHLDPSLSKTLTLDIGGRVDGLMRPKKNDEGTPVITISLINENSGRT